MVDRLSQMIRRELGIWSRLTHRNIVQFLGIVYGFGRQGSASLVSMWMPHGTLHTFLEMHDDRLAVAHRLQLASATCSTKQCSLTSLAFQLLDVANGLHYRGFTSFMPQTARIAHHRQCTRFR